MTCAAEDNEPEVTRAGLFSDLVGKTKEALGELANNDDLAEAGRAQQAEAEHEPDHPSAGDADG